MPRSRYSLILLSAVILAAGCADRTAAVKAATARAAAGIDADFKALRENLTTMVAEVEAVYAQEATLDLSIDRMDKADGGIFDYFRTEKGVIYFKTVAEGCMYYCSPSDGIVTAEIKRRIRLMQHQEGALIRAYEKMADWAKITFFGVHEPTSIGILYPYHDAVALYPPRLNFNAFDWYARGQAAPGAPRWSKAPFVDLSSGWVMDVAHSVSAGGRVVGTAVASVMMNKLSVKHLNPLQDIPLALFGNDLTVVGMTAPAKAILGIDMIEDYDYARQMRENVFATERFRLDGRDQSAEIRALAVRLQVGETEFTAELGGRIYRCFVARAPETGFFILGLK